MFRTIIVSFVALLLAGCATVPDPHHFVASSQATPLPQPRSAMAKPAVKVVSAELDCMADCLADDTCEACAESCLR